MPQRPSHCLLIVLLLTGSTCTRRFVGEASGSYGWFQIDAHGPPSDDLTQPSRRLERLALGPTHPPCEELQNRVDLNSSAPMLILVHGFGGFGPEWENSIAIVMRARPSAGFVYKWVPYEDRDLMAQRMAGALTHLAHCTRRSMIVLAHSAGGVLSSHAVSQLVLPEGVKLDLLTVASPLAGALARTPPESGEAELAFVLDLGRRIKHYPPAALGVRVWHLRTRFPADNIMEPGADGLSPNDISTGVPGAQRVTLPRALSHMGSLTWVARKLATASWLSWLEKPTYTPPEFLLEPDPT